MPSLAHLSDVHFGKIDLAVVRALIAELNDRKPDYVVVSGDLTQRARKRQFLDAKAFLDQLPTPLLVIPGNHDIPLWNPWRRYVAPLAKYKKYITTELNPTLSDKNVCVLGLNSTRPLSPRLHGFWKDGAISERQLVDLSLRASKAEPGALKIVTAHHPMIAPPQLAVHLPDIVRGAAKALMTFATCGVELILGGHLHRAYQGDAAEAHRVNGRVIYSLQAASATSTRLRGEANSYNWITWDEATVYVEVRAWKDNAFIDGQRIALARRRDSLLSTGK